MTRVGILTSTAPRHRYFVEIMSQAFDTRFVATQAKQNYYDDQVKESALIQRHFQDMDIAESAEFNPRLSSTGALRSAPDINDPYLVEEAKLADVDTVVLFGTSILREGWLHAFPGRIFNLHLGLSPYYRGSATLFWPFANGELECVGTTIHLAVAKVDAGPILAQIKPHFTPGDTYYSITNRLIRMSIDAMPGIVSRYIGGELQPVSQSAGNSRAWKKADFGEQALCKALDFIGAGLTAEQIRAIEASKKCPCLL